MFLFIFESIGTSELILIGIVALIFLGPRRLPEFARKAGKIMTEFRATTQDFKSTWEKEVNFEEEAKAFDLDSLETEAEDEGAKHELSEAPENSIGSPAIRQIDKESFDRIAGVTNSELTEASTENTQESDSDILSDKRNWL